MNGRGGRQFLRGGVGGQDPPRRRRFRGWHYIRRPSSFSDERNDSSPPPNQRDPRPLNNDQQQFSHQHYSQRTQRQAGRGSQRQHEQRDFYDNSYQRQHRRNYDASDNEYIDQNDQPQQQNHVDLVPPHPPQHQQPIRESNHHPTSSNRRVEEMSRSLSSQKTDIDEMRLLLSKLSTELDQVKNRVKELESSGTKFSTHQQLDGSAPSRAAPELETEKEKRRKSKILKQRERKALKLAEKRAAISENNIQSHQDQQRKILNSEQTDKSLDLASNQNNAENNEQPSAAAANPTKYNRRTNRERNSDKPRARREFRDKKQTSTKPLPKVNRNNINDDSTTQAAEPSSEDRPEGDDGREGSGKERVRVFRRKKQHFGRRGAYGNRRARRADSSERNSNDTSPQNEANGNDEYQDKKVKSAKKSYPELSDSEITDIVQTLKQEFVNLERPVKALKGTINAKGPKVAYEFAISILDHAMCDVTSPTKLSEIANNLYQLLVSEDNATEVDFQQSFYDALNDISKREDDIAIDAPRYMDTLGQILADGVVRMAGRQKDLVMVFLGKCIEFYSNRNGALLLASIMKSIASIKTERFAKEIWDLAQLDWQKVLTEGTDLAEFLESHDVKFTTQVFSPTPRATKSPKELEKFADDVTALVEKRCTPQALEELVKEVNFDPEDEVDYLGTLVYASVRGCLVTESGAYKLNNDALNKYSSILNTKNENQEAVALHALTALTKLWHQYNCPQDLFRTILLALHNQGIASHEALKVWLNSESLNNIPGIGAARLNSKRCIEDLEELNRAK